MKEKLSNKDENVELKWKDNFFINELLIQRCTTTIKRYFYDVLNKDEIFKTNLNLKHRQ